MPANSHGLPETHLTKGRCRTCSAKLGRGGLWTCADCQADNLAWPDVPYELRAAFWADVIKRRNERKIENGLHSDG